MTTWQVGLGALALHLVLCAVCFFLMRTHVLRVNAYVIPFVLFVPLWGFLSVLVLERHLRSHTGAVSEIPMEKLHLEDEIFQSLAPETSRQTHVAPLEEVLLLSPAQTRRRMMLDILNDEPEQYTDVLMKARSGDDTEVVHYATTAMAEMSKRHDLMLQHYENACLAKPDDPQVLREYADFLEDYLAHGFAKGRTERIERAALIRLLERLAGMEPTRKNFSRLIRQLFVQKSYARADELIADMQSRWSTQEEPRLFRMEWCALMGRGEELHECIRRARADGVYFSSRGEEQIRFWEEAPSS